MMGRVLEQKEYYTSFIGASKIGGNGWAIVHSRKIPFDTVTYKKLEDAIKSIREIRETGIYKLIEE